MKITRRAAGCLLALLVLSLACNNHPTANPFVISNAAVCQNVDENRRPQGIISTFPPGTEQRKWR